VFYPGVTFINQSEGLVSRDVKFSTHTSMQSFLAVSRKYMKNVDEEGTPRDIASDLRCCVAQTTLLRKVVILFLVSSSWRRQHCVSQNGLRIINMMMVMMTTNSILIYIRANFTPQRQITK
jgi:hypothetical protein